MNKTEARYSLHLELRQRAGDIRDFRFEPFKIRLADGTYYDPDFLVVNADRTITIHEVKGFWRDDARVKFKVAAETMPFFLFVAVTEKKGGVWDYEVLR